MKSTGVMTLYSYYMKSHKHIEESMRRKETKERVCENEEREGSWSGGTWKDRIYRAFKNV